MRKRWRRWKSGLTYRTKIAGSLLLTLVLLFSLWAYHGYPLPTAELEFRRLERTNLLPPSEVVFVAPDPLDDLEAADGTTMCLAEPVVVGVGADWATVGYGWAAGGPWDTVAVFPLNDGPSPVPLPAGHVSWVELDRDENGMFSRVHISCALLFLKMPEAARGELVLDVTYLEKDYHRMSEGWDLGDNVWLFALEPPEDSYLGGWYQGASYTLRLYRTDGTLLLEQSGTIPQAK